MIRLVALDLDGTLMAEDLHISPRVRQAIAAAQRRGVSITLATGRMFDVARPFALDLDITTPLICYQGGVIQAPASDAPLYRATMEPSLVREALAMQAHHGWRFVLYAEDKVFVADPWLFETYSHDLLGERMFLVQDLNDVLGQRVPDKFLIVADPPEADQIEDVIRRSFEGRMEVVRSHAMFVEGNPLGVSKGDALRRLAAHVEIPQSQVMAVGDQGNDASMLVWAGLGVAMGNGSPEVKAVADWIAPPLVEDGAAVAIERFVLDGSG